MSFGDCYPLDKLDFTKEFNEIFEEWDTFLFPKGASQREKAETIIKKKLEEKNKVTALRICCEPHHDGNMYSIWLKIGTYEEHSLHLFEENCAFIIEPERKTRTVLFYTINDINKEIAIRYVELVNLEELFGINLKQLFEKAKTKMDQWVDKEIDFMDKFLT